MTNESSVSYQFEKAAYIKIFDSIIGHNLLIEANPPHFTILAATPDRLRDVGKRKEEVVGKGLFEAHPGNSIDPSDNGASNLRASLDHVLHYKEMHQLPVQRYDLPDGNGSFTEKYWSATNRPVLNDEGEVAYIIHTAEDITCQIKAQAQVQLADLKKVFSLFMHAPIVAGLVTGDDHVLQMANNEAFRLWGKSANEVIGKPILKGVPELKGQGIVELFDKVHRSGEPYIGNEVPITSLVNGEKQQHYYNLFYQPYFGSDNGIVTGVFTMSHDVTANVLSKQKVEEREARYQTLFNSMDQGICIIEMIFDEDDKPVDYRFVEVNAMFENQTGLMQPAGKCAKELVPGLEQHWFEIYGDVARTGKSVRFIEGSEAMGRLFEVNAFRADGQESNKVAVLFTDVTEKSEAERTLQDNKQLLQTVFDASPNSLTVYEPIINPDGSVEDFRFLMVNEFTVRTTGRSDLAGKFYGEEFPNVKENGVLDKFKEVAATGQSADFEKWYVGEDMKYWFRFIVNKVGKLLVVTTENITERKETEDKLRRSESYFRQLTDTVPAIIWITRPDGYCTYLNNSWYNYTGQTEGEAEGFGWLNATHPDDAEEAGRLFVEATEKQAPYHMLYRLQHATGEYRWAIDSGQPKFSEAGVFEGMIGTVIDVHEQKLAEDKIRESEERFRSMANASPMMIWTLDEAGNSTYYNRRAREFTGHTDDELKEGKSWQMAIHPDDIDYAANVVSKAVAARKPYAMECRMQNAQGEWRWLFSEGIPRFGNQGEYFGFVGSSVDITDHKRSQQELQTALEQTRLSKEAAELGTFDMNLENGDLHWDDRCRALFGISHQQDVSFDDDFLKRLHPDDKERVEEVVRRVFVKSLSNGDYDVEYRTIGAEDGVVRWVRAKGKVYFTPDEKPVRFIGSVLDITQQVDARQRVESLVAQRTSELAEANENLSALNRELQRSNQNLEEFAHAASHDLKEPVRKIHFFTHQLREQLKHHLKETEIRSFSRIESATQRMGNLIDDLLLYSHVSHRPQETETVDLNEKVQRVLEDLELDIAEKKATLQLGNLPVVNGYRRQLQQLFQNLISNALKYSKADIPPHIDIMAEETEKEGKSYHLISVKDNGIGFEPVYAEKIFQMFARLHGKNEYSGTGVGLSIVKRVVENHYGFIEVDSNVGEGSVFKIYLPVSIGS